MSVPMQKVRAWAISWEDKWADHYHRTGKAGHPGFNGLVTVVDESGSTFTYFDAFAVKHCPRGWDDDFVVVFTEHHGFHIFAEDDLLHYSQWEDRVRIPHHDDDHKEIAHDGNTA